MRLPREIWVPEIPTDKATLSTWLTELRGGKVTIRQPKRGPKATLMETVHTNAEQALRRHKLARAGDITERSQALEELREGHDGRKLLNLIADDREARFEQVTELPAAIPSAIFDC